MKLKRVVVLTGTSGLDLDRAVKYIGSRLGVPTAKYEDYVEEYMRAPIYHVAELLLADYRTTAERFKKAFEHLLDDLRDEEEALITAHIVYYRRLNTIVSPFLAFLAELSTNGLKVALVDYIDDYYHVLYRLARRAAERVTPDIASFQPLDPVGLLSWRGVNLSLIHMLSVTTMDTVVFASKHSAESHARLVAMLLGKKAENGKRYESVYVSHPITKVRARAEREGVGLSRYPDAIEIEEFKERLEKSCPNLVVYSPTTIDELIIDSEGKLITKITRDLRWPHRENNIHEYAYPIDLADEIFDRNLYPVKSTIRNEGYLYFLKTQIEASIERRDLSYVSQADYVVAYRPTLYGEQHMGVETEIKTAIAMAKPVFSVIPEEERKIPYTLFRFEYPLRSVEDLLRVLKCE